jgi:hypothetical protein
MAFIRNYPEGGDAISGRLSDPAGMQLPLKCEFAEVALHPDNGQ